MTWKNRKKQLLEEIERLETRKNFAFFDRRSAMLAAQHSCDEDTTRQMCAEAWDECEKTVAECDSKLVELYSKLYHEQPMVVFKTKIKKILGL